MSIDLQELFQKNRDWAADTESREPGFFTRLIQQQSGRLPSQSTGNLHNTLLAQCQRTCGHIGKLTQAAALNLAACFGQQGGLFATV